MYYTILWSNTYKGRTRIYWFDGTFTNRATAKFFAKLDYENLKKSMPGIKYKIVMHYGKWICER